MNKKQATIIDQLLKSRDSLALIMASSGRDSLLMQMNFRNITVSVQSLDSRLNALEETITQTPEKALVVPMLRQDFNNLKEQVVTKSSDMNAAIGDLRELMLTIFGSIVGLFALIVGLNFWASRSARKQVE